MAAADMAVPVQEVAGEIVQYGSFHHPDRFLATAELVAKAFKKRADQLALFKQIGPSKHLLVEGWQMLAAMYHVSARMESDQYVQFGDAFGFEAVYVALHVPSGTTISRASAMCLNTEENWGLRPRYEGKGASRKQVGMEPTPLQQIRSMAQTRAESKCLSNVLKWVAKMAGFAVTPADEMTGNEPGENGGAKSSVQQPQEKPQSSQNGGNKRVITEKQAGRIWGIAHSLKVPREVVGEILTGHGFEDAASVTTDLYDAICAAIEKSGEDVKK